jgi:hypothetical protein
MILNRKILVLSAHSPPELSQFPRRTAMQNVILHTFVLVPGFEPSIDGISIRRLAN